MEIQRVVFIIQSIDSFQSKHISVDDGFGG